MPYFQLLRKPWKDTGDIGAVSVPALCVLCGERVSPLIAALYEYKDSKKV